MSLDVSSARRSLLLNDPHGLVSVVGAGQYLLDLHDLEDALDDWSRAELENHRLLSSTGRDRSSGLQEDVDDTGIDERCLTQVEDEVRPRLEGAVNLITEGWRVREVELSLQADGDDLVGLGDNANDSVTLLGAH
jgi:hypothetical protein